MAAEGDAVLERQRELLLRGDLGGAAALLPELERLVDRAHGDVADPRMRAAALRNRALLAGILASLRERRARVGGLRTYGANGRPRAMR